MIRSAKSQDIAQCAKVIRESFGTVAEEFGITEERLLSQMEDCDRHMYVHIEDGEITGYFSLLLKEDGLCELNNLCVLPEHRHKGVGAKFLRYAIEAARRMGCSKMEIGIVEENTALRRWYESFGFQHTGTKKFEFFPFTCGYMERDLQKMANLTRHGAKRVKERLNIPKKAAGKNAELAFRHGLKQSECKGDLYRYIVRLYFQHGSGSDYRIYNHYVYCFTFKDHKLKTAMPLPQRLHKLADKLQQIKESKESGELAVK